MEMNDQLHTLVALPRGVSPRYLLEAGLDALAKRKNLSSYRESNTGCPARRIATILTELLRLPQGWMPYVNYNMEQVTVVVTLITFSCQWKFKPRFSGLRHRAMMRYDTNVSEGTAASIFRMKCVLMMEGGVITQRTTWSLYSVGTRFESWPCYRLSWVRFSTSSSASPMRLPWNGPNPNPFIIWANRH
jgi:hypothetical protein